MQGTAQIQGLNVLEQGDSVTIWVDPASQMMRRVEIKTIYDKKPATLVADYPKRSERANLHGSRGAVVSGEERGAHARQLRLRTNPAVKIGASKFTSSSPGS